MLYYSLVIAVICTCAWHAFAATPIACTGENEEYSNCASLCGDYCPTPENPVFCPAVCVNGCQCKRNFKRDPETKKCIPISDCKVKCPDKNAIFGCVCNDSCNDKIRCVRCLHRCGCKTGFKSINGTCQPKSLCPKP